MNECRKYWVEMLVKMAKPVLENFNNETLHKNLEVETYGVDREQYKGLEILGRTLSGLAPWIETPAIDPEEEKLRQEYAELSRKAIAVATDENSPDYCIFSTGEKKWNMQWAVDSAYLALAIIRAPKELNEKLDETTRKNLAHCFRLTRDIRTPFNNWIIFQAITEAGLYALGEDYDVMRIDYALRQFEQWYAGDGFYQDGPLFQLDYYNSYVMHPMLAHLADMFYKSYIEKHHHYSPDEPVGEKIYRAIMSRFERYAAIQEMSVAPDGSYPPFGRSLIYRGGAFQTLAQAALWKRLPETVTPAMARIALTRVIKKTLDAENTFREDGFLNIGVCGYQPKICQSYTTTASLYMATLAFLPLGLDENDEFWSSPDELSTWEKVFSGVDMPSDHAMVHDGRIY